jgi:hypothetical protein
MPLFKSAHDEAERAELTLAERAAIMRNIDDKYLHCRAKGHKDWQPEDWYESIKTRVARIIERCPGCGTTKETEIDTRNDGWEQLGPTRYAYPPGYLLEGVGRYNAGDRAMVRGRFYREDPHWQRVRHVK